MADHLGAAAGVPPEPTPRWSFPESRDAAAQTFLNEMLDAFGLASKASGGSLDRFFRIAGKTVQLRFAGPALPRLLTPALEHLSAEPGHLPDLVVCLWDSDSTGIDRPGDPWTTADYGARGELRGASSAGVHVALAPVSSALSVFDERTGVACFWVRGADSIMPWEVAAPQRSIFAWWASGRGDQLAHAAAVGFIDGGVLLAARGGSGKSTTALACIESGFLFAGDDYILLRDDGEPYAFSLYNSAKLAPQHLRDRLPHLEQMVIEQSDPGEDKSTILLHAKYPSLLTDRIPLRAILVPSLAGDGRTSLRPISAAETFKALAPTTMLQLPGAGATALGMLARLVKRLPGYALELGTDFGDNVSAIRAILRAHSPPAAHRSDVDLISPPAEPAP